VVLADRYQFRNNLLSASALKIEAVDFSEADYINYIYLFVTFRYEINVFLCELQRLKRHTVFNVELL